MIENILVFVFISVLVYFSKEKRAVGWLVLFYYAVYIIIALDYFGPVIDTVFSKRDIAILWYLIYTAISTVFFIACLNIYIRTHHKTPLFYACWILLNIIVSGLSAIFQAFETNALLSVYNALQDINLFIDILVVIVGTDTKLKGSFYVRSVVNSLFCHITSYINIITKNRNRCD